MLDCCSSIQPHRKDLPWGQEGLCRGGITGRALCSASFCFETSCFQAFGSRKRSFYLQPLLLGYSSFSWKAIPSLSLLSEPS